MLKFKGDTFGVHRMKNIVGIYFENKKEVPFIVRRESWSEFYGILVTSVKPQKTPSGWYGDVYGYPLPPLNGSKVYDYWGKTGKPQKVKNSGSYQWAFVKPVPKEWIKFLLAD